MCGIVGVMGFKSTPYQVEEKILLDMRDSLAHRGPDGAGSWISKDRKVGLGHRRLSIIDLSTSANQPMANQDGSLQVVFNGEIYNHAEIRKELESKGKYRWKTDHSDTEVILHAFEEWGIDCLQRFRGMFAIGLWDGRKRELWLIRDRIGVKPLYYSTHHGRITFASEIKALLKDPGQEKAMDEESLYHFLSFLAVPAPRTLFNGIRKLAGGTYLKVSEDGSAQEGRYWDLWDHTQPLTGVSEEEIAERLLQELRTAVRLRKVSDVPVGIFLSGGLDSSTNAMLFSEGEGKQVQTFSIGYEGENASYKNELFYAKLVADRVGANYHEKLLNVDDLLSFLPRMVYLLDEPLADPVCVPTYYVSKLARDNGVTVCQLGEGSDELFWGYAGWRKYLKVQKYDDLPVPQSLKRLGLAAMRLAGKENGFGYELLRRGAEGQPVFWGGTQAFFETQKQKMLSPRLRARFKGYTSWEALRPIRERFESKAWEKSPLNWMSYLDLNFRLPELLLMRADKMTMGVGLEGRVPFLDHKFVELAMSIPSSVKTTNGSAKYILKKAVKGVVPDEIIARVKQPWDVPLFEWYFGTLGDKCRKEIMEFCEKTDFFDRGEIERYVARGFEGSGRRAWAWYLLNLAMWWKEYME